jgi:hypothetical protein
MSKSKKLFFVPTGKLISKFMWTGKGTRNIKDNIEKE